MWRAHCARQTCYVRPADPAFFFQVPDGLRIDAGVSNPSVWCCPR